MPPPGPSLVSRLIPRVLESGPMSGLGTACCGPYIEHWGKSFSCVFAVADQVSVARSRPEFLDVGIWNTQTPLRTCFSQSRAQLCLPDLCTGAWGLGLAVSKRLLGSLLSKCLLYLETLWDRGRSLTVGPPNSSPDTQRFLRGENEVLFL